MSIAALPPLLVLLLAPAFDGGASAPVPAPEPFVSQASDPLLEPVPRAAREVHSWDEARAWVRQNSSDERIAAAGVERAQGRWRQALSVLLPNARLGFGAQLDALNPTVPPSPGLSPTVAGSYTPTSPLGTANAVLSQTVVDLGAFEGLGSAAAARQSAELQREDLQRRLTRGLARALVAVVAAERVAELNRVGLRQALERGALIERTQQLGAATQLDVVRVRQDVEVARGALIAGDEQLRRTREALGLALGLEEEVGLPADFSLDALATEARRACQSVDGEHRADLEAARATAASATAARRQASRGYLPTLGVTANLFGYTTTQTPVRVATWNLAAVLSVPLWEGGFREGLTQERAGLERQAEAGVDLAHRQVHLEGVQARRGVGVAEALAATAEASRSSAAQLDALTRRSFEVGRGSSLELVQSAAVLRQADVALATRQFELVQARLEVLMTEARCDW